MSSADKVYKRGACVACKDYPNWPESFHRVPQEPIRREEWCRVLGLASADLAPHAAVCAKHFSRDQYVNKSKIWLKKSAVPNRRLAKGNILAQLLGGETSVTLNLQPPAPLVTNTRSKASSSAYTRKLVNLAPAPIQLRPVPVQTFLPFTPLLPTHSPSPFRTATNSSKKLVNIRPKDLPLQTTNILPTQIPISIYEDEDEDNEKPTLLPLVDRDPLAPDSPVDPLLLDQEKSRLRRMKNRVSPDTSNQKEYLEILPTINPSAPLQFRPRILTRNTQRFITITGENDTMSQSSPIAPATESSTLPPQHPPTVNTQRFVKVTRIPDEQQPRTVEAVRIISLLPNRPHARIAPQLSERNKEIHGEPTTPDIIPLEPCAQPHPQQTGQTSLFFPNNQPILFASPDMLSSANESEALKQKDLVIEIQRKALEAFKNELSSKVSEIGKLSQRLVERKKKLDASRAAVQRVRKRIDADVEKVLRKTFKGSRTLRELIVSQYLRYSKGADAVGPLVTFTNTEKELGLNLLDSLGSTAYEKILEIGFILPGSRFVKQLQMVKHGGGNQTSLPAVRVQGIREEYPGFTPQDSMTCPPNRKRKALGSRNSTKSLPYKVQRLPTGEKCFLCWKCTFRSSSKNKAEKHAEQHLVVPTRVYSCRHRGCEYQTRKKPLLICHQRGHAAGKGIACPDCHEWFRSSASLRLHGGRCQKRSNNEIHVCPGTSCHFTTFDRSSFRSHLKSCRQSHDTLFQHTQVRHSRPTLILST